MGLNSGYLGYIRGYLGGLGILYLKGTRILTFQLPGYYFKTSKPQGSS